MQPALSSFERVLWGQQAHESIGIHSLWGLSPALNLLRGVNAAKGEEPCVVLISAGGDVRHILRTLSERQTKGPIHFYVHETSVDVLARHVLLLRVAFDWELPLKQRVSAWLEIFGNGLVQERTERYVGRLGREILDMATNGQDDSLVGDVIDLSRLKFRDRDLLAEAARSWKCDSFRFKDFWDHRLRTSLGARYDNRVGAFDWDYRRGLEPAGAGIVHVKQYKHWRETGVAFEFGDQEYTKPNRSFASFARGLLNKGKDRGQQRDVKGYWGDSVVGPYAALGVELADVENDDNATSSRAKSLLKIVDKGTGTERYRHNATEVAVYNMLSFLWGLENGTPYEMTVDHEVYSGLGSKAATTTTTKNDDALERAKHIFESLDQVAIFPLSGDFEDALKNKRCPSQLDVVFLGLNAAHHIQSSQTLHQKMNAGGKLVVETAKYLIPLKLEQRHLFVRKVHAMAMQQGRYTPNFATTTSKNQDGDSPNKEVAALLGDCETTPVDLDLSALYFTAAP